MNSRQIDFKQLAAWCLQHSDQILTRWLPGGYVVSGEYVIRNPKRHDTHTGSFKVNTRTGKWGDFATGDTGGDLISLIAYLDNTSQLQAAKRLQGFIGKH